MASNDDVMPKLLDREICLTDSEVALLHHLDSPLRPTEEEHTKAVKMRECYLESR